MPVAGTRFGPYEIVSPLGAGGMGEVYRARDTKLGREVAIKILPASFATDPDRLARFEREARVLASLNHPHIAQIYGLETTPSPCIVMELVDGETLADRLRGRESGLGVRDSVAIAQQIADALDAAHERGIVHRDLKPANVAITADGVVKVLDFGLAKADDSRLSSGASAEDLTNSPTNIGPTLDGVLLGTAPYMSPEQARGKVVDKRADIWAFGCVLYEMLTGRGAFGGESTSDTIAAILEREPDWTRLPSSTPAALVQTLRRCLEKNPKRRLRDIADARIEADTHQAGAVSRERGWATMVAWGLVAALTAALAWALRVGTRSAADAASTVTLERLTYDAGLTANPTVSKDGRLLAYASDRSGRGDLDIWIQQTAGGAPLRLTDDPSDDQTPDLSPDGSTVVFRSERNGGGAYLVPAFGGEQRLLASDARRPKFSPDGSRVAYWSGVFRGGVNGASKTFVLPLGGGDAVRVLPTFEVARDPVWAPDGRSLLVIARERRVLPGTAGSALTEWWWTPLDGRPPVRTTTIDSTGGPGVFPSAWSASGVVFSQGGDVWSMPLSMTTGLPTGPSRRLTTAAQRYADPAVTSDGDIVFTAYADQRVIERAPLPSGPPVTLYADSRSDTGRSTQTRDGTQIVFERGLTRTREIWLKDVRSGRQRMVLQLDGPRQVDPVISPDGSRIAYTAGTTGSVIETAGGVPRRVCDNCQLFGFLSDNRRVLSSDHVVGRVIDATSLSAQDLLIGGSVNLSRLHASPDDRWLAFESGNKSYVVPLTPGHPAASEKWMRVDEPTTTGRPCGWSPDSRVLYLLLDLDGFRCLYGQRVDPSAGLVGQPSAVRHFHDHNNQQGFGTGYGDAISAEGFLYEGGRTSGNLWRLVVPKVRQ